MEMKKFKYTINVGEDKKLSKEVLYLLESMGFKGFRYNPRESAPWVYVNDLGDIMVCSFKATEDEEITLQQLRDLVVLKRNSIDDATHRDSNKYDWYVASDEKHYRMQGNIWVYQPYVDCHDLKPIEKEVKMKEYLDTNYELRSVKQTSGDNHTPSGWIEVPEGAEIFLLDTSCGEDIFYFVKHDGEVFHEYYIDATDVPNNVWIKGTIKELHKDMGKILWKRKHTKTVDSKDTTIQDKLKFIEKWLNGEKIQYILGIESEKTQ